MGDPPAVPDKARGHEREDREERKAIRSGIKEERSGNQKREKKRIRRESQKQESSEEKRTETKNEEEEKTKLKGKTIQEASQSERARRSIKRRLESQEQAQEKRRDKLKRDMKQSRSRAEEEVREARTKIDKLITISQLARRARCAPQSSSFIASRRLSSGEPKSSPASGVKSIKEPDSKHRGIRVAAG
ncbi:hypothetical protein WME76_31070 [Sorangium sp. So ce119]|uniref:hypothetical protein n=1 Tax=Sorangium sp. So ce119 TaxID=3133279 RepID=UPI003F5D933E